ncbi:MAG: hypothetical protein QOE93_1363 [Actinomycetota bacterium]|jgi:hypothetical protein|nr:hypothetical protein [Actinomycetota bacterium]
MYDFSPGMDEATADLLLSRRSIDLGGWDEGAAAVAEFLVALHDTVLDPPAPPCPALAAVLRDGLPTEAAVVARTRHVGRERQPAGWRRVVTVIGLGIGVAASGITVAAAANLLPAGPERVVESVIRTLTPFTIGTSPPTGTAPAELRKTSSGTELDGRGADAAGRTGASGELGDAPSVGATGGPAAGGPGNISPPAASGLPIVPPTGTASPTATSGTPDLPPPAVPNPNLPPATAPYTTTPPVPEIPTTSVPQVTTPSTTLPGLNLP